MYSLLENKAIETLCLKLSVKEEKEAHTRERKRVKKWKILQNVPSWLVLNKLNFTWFEKIPHFHLNVNLHSLTHTFHISIFIFFFFRLLYRTSLLKVNYVNICLSSAIFQKSYNLIWKINQILCKRKISVKKKKV